MQNFEMFAGDTKKLNVTVTDNGTPADITGATIKWVMRKTVTSAANEANKSIGNGITIIDATAGLFQITLSPSDTLTLKGYYYHEAEVTDALGNVSTVMAGSISILLSAI